MDVIWILHVFPSQYGIFNGILYGIIYRICEEVFDVSEMDIALRFGDEIRNGSPGLLAHGGKDLIGPFLVITNIYLPHAHVYTQMCVYIYIYITTYNNIIYI